MMGVRQRWQELLPKSPQTAAPSANKAAGAEKWEAESSLLSPSSMSEKFESPIGWDRS